MGRWGYTVFQGDSDLDLVSEFEAAVGVPLYAEPKELEEAREKLDAGLGAELMSKQRAAEQVSREITIFDQRYTTLLLGAYMMHVGAAISSRDREHLNVILPEVESRNGYTWPLNDEGFRDPGQIQYKAALDNYIDGKPRSFFDASCFNCGKTSYDIAPEHLKHCTRCEKNGKTAPYCNRECQKKNWQKHKVICGRPKSNGAFQMMNV